VIILRINTDRKTKNNKKGVTLVEMLIVMLIIGAIVGVLIFNFSEATDKAREAKAKGDLREAKINVFLDLMDGRYSGNMGRLIELVMKLKDISDPTVDEKLSKLPVGSGSNLNKYLAEFVAAQIGQEVYSPGYQRSSLTGIEVPHASATYVNSSNQGIYLAADHVRQDYGEEIASLLGYAIPVMTQAENPDIYWASTGAGGATVNDRYVFIGHLRIRIYENKEF